MIRIYEGNILGFFWISLELKGIEKELFVFRDC